MKEQGVREVISFIVLGEFLYLPMFLNWIFSQQVKLWAEKFSDTGKLFSVDRSRGGGRGQFIPPIKYIVILVSLMILLF